MKQKTLGALALCAALSCNACGDNTDKGVGYEAEYALFKTEKAAWENAAVTEYYLTLTHANGAARYTTMALVKDDTPEYIETSGVSVTLAVDFPFEPLVGTIQGLYETLEKAFAADASVEVAFDTQAHTPKQATIKNYDGAGNDYSVSVDSFVKVKGAELLDMEGLEPFDAAVFAAERAAWEAEHPGTYSFYQEHYRHSQVETTWSLHFSVVDDTPDEYSRRVELIVSDSSWGEGTFSLPEENEWTPFLLSKTISELYEKIEAVWAERSYTGAAFLIKYDAQRHYPTLIQIKNVNASGYDYLVRITFDYGQEYYLDRPTIFFWWGGEWL
jgi:hypothetical protein